MDKNYEHSHEEKWYKIWLNSSVFSSSSGSAFAIAIPPPNVTGMLHIGHCLNNTMQDIYIRYKKMKGYDAIWIPGLDHAGISTQQKVMESLKGQKVTKELFLEKAWEWKEKYGNTILEQFKKLGLALDWKRERFTLDEKYKNAVNTIFKKLYNDGLIYKGEYIVNWSTVHSTAISDDEVVYKNLKRTLYHIVYKVDNEEVVVATTRPETIFGDVALACNPSDERYSHLIGKQAIIPIINRAIPIIGDEYVKKDFGSGLLKITPGHDAQDFKLAKKHNLPILNIYDENLNVKYYGCSASEARERVLKELKVVQVSESESPIGFCSKSDTPIETIISTQWFVKMKPLVQDAIAAVKNGEIEFYPKYWEKTYFHWLENIEDWCISRQLWWGHEIPNEKDVLDTWFSSALWPFAILGWPEVTEDLKRYFPTDLIFTGGDIIFFWIARMIIFSYYCLGSKPFSRVIFHGIVRDDKGRKMSKSLGNSPDSLKLIEKYGADSLRFGLIYNTPLGNDLFYSEELVKFGQSFCNKLWNTFRFIQLSKSKANNLNEIDIIDKWILGELDNTIKLVEENIENYNLDIALKAIYSFFWNDFADWYIELSKNDLKASKIAILEQIMQSLLKLLHPFIPFVTEELNSLSNTELLLNSKYPAFQGLERIKLESFKDIIKIVRSIRQEFVIKKEIKLELEVKFLKASIESSLIQKIENFVNVKIAVVESFSKKGLLKSTNEVQLSLNSNLINIENEIIKLEERLNKDRILYEKTKQKLESDFVKKAKQEVIQKELEILKEYKDKVEAATIQLEHLKRDE